MLRTVSRLDSEAPSEAISRGVADGCTTEQRLTRSLLGYGIVAGPFYVVVSLAQAVARDGFELSRHQWSLLANGPWGWVQVTNLILSGAMIIAAAVGYRRILGTGAGGRWAPRLLAVYGACLVAAGVFRADPMSGFPVGAPDGPPVTPTLDGTLHMVAGGVGFLALIALTFVMARRFRQQGRRGRATFSIVTGVGFLAGFAGIASGSTKAVVTLGFTAAVLGAWAWVTSTSLDLYRQAR